MPYESAMQNRKMAMVVMAQQIGPTLENLPQIVEQVGAPRPGTFTFIDMPPKPKPEYKPPEE